MTSAAWEQRRKGVETILERWKGGQARIWDYSVSHRQMVVRIEEAGRFGNLHVICLDLSFIHGPTEWSNADLKVEAEFSLELGEVLYRVTDVEGDFEARAGAIEVKENCKPIARIDDGSR